jgi:uncharacterized protein (TIGR00730 family)
MKKICVFLGSNSGARPEYREAAVELGQSLARAGVGLVYGGAKVGLMGTLADAALAAGGDVVGIIPRALVEKEVAHSGLSDLRVVTSMHERKSLMAELSDGFIALPGGMGTLEELFEMLTWAQLGMHRKPCGLLNVAGYYDGLSAFLDHAVGERFVAQAHRDMLLVGKTAKDLLASFSTYRPPIVEKWIERKET